ncbi:MAG: hypothetical protein JWL62_2685 [Hyphomicrobiales bacterium]|nr:hypothetical protein [Hyphomicrobiales bacterium]
MVRSGIDATAANKHNWRLLDIEVLERMADIRGLLEMTPAIERSCEMVIWNCLEFTHAAVLAEDGDITTSPGLTNARIQAMSALADLTLAIEHARPSALARSLDFIEPEECAAVNG